MHSRWLETNPLIGSYLNRVWRLLLNRSIVPPLVTCSTERTRWFRQTVIIWTLQASTCSSKGMIRSSMIKWMGSRTSIIGSKTKSSTCSATTRLRAKTSTSCKTDRTLWVWTQANRWLVISILKTCNIKITSMEAQTRIGVCPLIVVFKTTFSLHHLWISITRSKLQFRSRWPRIRLASNSKTRQLATWRRT